MQLVNVLLIKMAVKFNIPMKLFVLVTKVTPMLLALFHLLNTILSYFYIDCVFLNYLAGISIITVTYLYFTSYALKLCEYYRMFLHYCLILDIINAIDYYFILPISDISLYLLIVIVTIIFMFLIIYLKFFK